MKLSYLMQGTAIADRAFMNEMSALGADFPLRESGVFGLNLLGDDIRLPEALRLARKYDILVSKGTYFESHDFEKAPWIRLVSLWDPFYPQPEDDYAYMSATYDLSDYCKKCGTGYVQNKPFRIKRKPRWGSHSIFSLIGVQDALFVRKALGQALLEQFGIPYWPLLLHQSGEEIDDVVQLKIETTVPLDLEDTRLLAIGPKTCTTCLRVRYEMPYGYVPRPIGEHNVDLLQSSQFFGYAGSEAWRALYASPRLYRFLSEDDDLRFETCPPNRSLA